MDLPFDRPEIYKYLESNFTAENFVKNWYLRTITTEISVGTPNETYKADILDNYTRLELGNHPRFQKEVNNKYYPTISTSFKESSPLTVYKNWEKITISGDIIDNFHLKFSDNLNSKKYKIKDYPIEFRFRIEYIDNVTKNKEDIHPMELTNFTNAFILGLQISSEYETNKKNLIQSLKAADIIDSYDFSFEFYNNPKIDMKSEEDEVGRLVFGKFEQLYKKEKYQEDYLKTTKLLNDYRDIKYLIYMSEIYLEKKEENYRKVIQTDDQVEFVFDSNLFNAPYFYRDEIAKQFFEKYEDGKMCEYQAGDGVDRSGTNTFYVYVCDKELVSKHKDDFPVLKFYSKDLDFTFEFGYDDLFREYLGKVYFLVLFPKGKYHWRDWEVGKIFLKKYKLFFNVDQKLLKFYSGPIKYPKKESKAKKAFKIIGEIILVCILVVVAYYIGKKINQRRKL